MDASSYDGKVLIKMMLSDEKACIKVESNLAPKYRKKLVNT